jgi:hypothetical protein
MIRFLVRKEARLTSAALVLLSGICAAQPAAAQIKCFPSCSSTDGRFLVIASGTGLVTLSEEQLDVQFAVPAGTTSFKLGVFDGDGGGLDLAGKAHWDFGLAVPYSFTLYADPLGDGTGTTVVDMLPGLPTVVSLTMPDNDWIDYPINTSDEARTPSGNYFYRLKIQLLNNLVSSYNSFKLRTDGIVSIRLADQPFSYIAALRTVDERGIIYPAFPSLTPTTYDGTFQFFFDIAEPRTELTVWDGDFDRGNADGTNPDTDDADTPNAPFLPFWATTDAVPEGVATGLGASTGNPPDDLAATSILRRSPAIQQDLLFPDGQVFTNANPSGNQEWEQYLISTDPFDPSTMDASTSMVPTGTYELRINGVDMGNLNALRLPSEALCVSETFEPCTPLRPFLVGDTVFRDLDGDGIQSGAGETGIAGVVVELVGTAGFVITTTTTDADGSYSFPVEAGTYTVRIADSSSDPGEPLDGAIATTPVQLTESVVDDNVLTYDFGYRGTSSVGDRVWFDGDGNGIQGPGEAGLDGITVELLDGDGNILDSTTTTGDGAYSFDHLFPGSYSVRVVASTLPGGVAATYDLDGTGTPDVAAATLGAGESRTDVDFGYRGTGSIGDRLWYDHDGDGSQDASEPGLSGATVELLDSDGNVIATAITGSDGLYTFNDLPAGSYTVRVVSATLPVGGLAPTYDLDGTGTPHTAAVTLAGDSSRTDIDFGYRGTRSLGDRVWSDTDGDGTQDASETGINGVTVRLFLGTTEVASTVTSGNGNYTFTNLPETTFTVRIETATLPAGATQTYDLDGTATPHEATVNLTTNRTDVDFGYRTQPISCTAGTFKDHFNAASFSNNDGSLSWSGAWVEYDVAGTGVNSGNVTVGNPYGGYLFLRDKPDTGTQPSAARQVNLTGFTSATLLFDFHVRTAVDPDDAVVIEVSKNGGSTYTILETLSGFSGTYQGSRIYNISGYIASNTRIRFRVGNGYGSSDELFKLDWVKIDAGCAPAAAPGTGTIGYWKTHPEAWPVQQITVGGKIYTKSQAIQWMGTSSSGDKTIDLFKQLVAAKLNVLIGNQASCISSTIFSADAWLVSYPLGSRVKSSGSAWQTGGPLHERLDDYNNGELCAPHRD